MLPVLSVAEVAAIGDTVFISNNVSKSDLLFVFGSSHDDWSLVASLFSSGIAPLILVTGRAGEDYYATGVPQAHRIRQELVKLGVPAASVLVEDQSDNTLQNAKFGHQILANHDLHPRTILFVCNSHHSGRAWRTLSLVFPNTELRCVTYDASYESRSVTRESWFTHGVGRRRVYGEFQRIQLYASRGQVSFHGPSSVV